DPGGLEVVAHRCELVVVGGLAGEVLIGEGHVEHVVDPVEVLLGQLHQVRPDPQGLGVAGLQGRDPGAGAGGEVVAVGRRARLLGRVELGARGLIERVRIRLQQLRLGAVLAHLEQMLDEHAEGGAPVADVVLAHHGAAELLERAGEPGAGDAGARSGTCAATQSVRRRTFRKPGPPISGARAMSERSTASTISAAMSRGLRPSRLARPIAALHWKSANCEGGMIGSASAYSGPKAAAKAVWKRWVSAISGAGMPQG